jgi:hypothetical protein
VHKHLSWSMPFAALLCTIAISVEAQAFEQGNYTTPDSLTQQVSPGQLQESSTGIGVAGTKVYATLTSRYRLRFNDFGSNHLGNDQDFYQYLRVRTDPMKLGNGTVALSAYARFATDTNGDKGNYEGNRNGDLYYYYRDILDAERKHDDWATRLYLGTATFDNVIKNTSIILGRVNLAHQNSFTLDGADATVKLADAVSAYVYGGRPASFYYHTGNDNLVGGGITVKAAKKTTVGGEYTRLYTQGVSSDYGKLRIDQAIPSGTVALGYTNLDNASALNADIAYELTTAGTILTGKYEGLLNNSSTNSSYVVNQLTSALATESRYNKYELGLYQALLKHFSVGITFQERLVEGPENLNNRSYERIGGKFDISGIPTDNTYISFSADYWGIRRTSYSNTNDSIQYGVQINQKITKSIDIWGGTSYNRYDYDLNPNYYRVLTTDPSSYVGNTDKRMDWARSYFVGGQYKPSKHLSFMADMNIEHGSFYNAVDNRLNTNYTTEIWANIIF